MILICIFLIVENAELFLKMYLLAILYNSLGSFEIEPHMYVQLSTTVPTQVNEESKDLL